jgi:N-formylglutamate deformylase
MKSLKIKTDTSNSVLTSIHSGHRIRPQLLPYLKLSESERLLEEDPFTDEWVKISDNSIRVLPSRFEVDINRPRNKSIYMCPQDAWGLEVWTEKLPDEIVEKSLQVYDEIYTQFANYFDDLLAVHKYLIIYDLHTYNHRREGFDKYANPKENPEINIGTGNLNRGIWSGVVDDLIESINSYNFEGRYLSVGENIKFRGGHFGSWLVARYQDLVCPISIEVKKFFMNEWTGDVYKSQLIHIRELLIKAVRPHAIQYK